MRITLNFEDLSPEEFSQLTDQIKKTLVTGPNDIELKLESVGVQIVDFSMSIGAGSIKLGLQQI
jgi:hypothetical protein